MTEKENEILTLLYALGKEIEDKNWPDAVLIWERLLLMHSPLAEMQPHLGKVLRNEATMIQMAERQSSKIH
jgi:hypothetical protein